MFHVVIFCSSSGRESGAAATDDRLRTPGDFHVQLRREPCSHRDLDEGWPPAEPRRAHAVHRLGQEGRQGNVSVLREERPGKRTGQRRTQAR